MQNVVDLGHFNGAAHEVGTLVDEFVLFVTAFTRCGDIGDRLDVGMGLSLDYTTHLV